MKGFIGDGDMREVHVTAECIGNKEIEYKVTPAKFVGVTPVKKLFLVKEEEGIVKPIEKGTGNKCGFIKNGSVILDGPIDVTNRLFLSMGAEKSCEVDFNKMFQSDSFTREYSYSGEDLGVCYQKEGTTFRIWTPFAKKVDLCLYKTGHEEDLFQKIEMEKCDQGLWKQSVEGDLDGVYYTYLIHVYGKEFEVVDPYAKAVGVNGNRGMIVDLGTTDPEEWDADVSPVLERASDSILYELHVRDMGMDPGSGMWNEVEKGRPGSFLSLVRKDTRNVDGLATGIDHLKELGITHVHLLPAFDFATVDESRPECNQFNWGYDPKNYNVPEGSYSTDPYNGKVRIREFKQMVKGFHENGIRVVMDMVYNHTEATEDSFFNQIAPGYYYRKHGKEFSSGSGCGNETASERSMVRKFIVESVVYWAKEYHIDGFRFDLMGLHDIETMNAIRTELDKFRPDIILYGEGWTGGDSPLPEENSACKKNTYKMRGMSSFNDDLRDGIKGYVFEEKAKGFVSGLRGQEERIKFGIVGAVAHPQVHYKKPWAMHPYQSIAYVSAHDNLTLWDKLAVSAEDESEENRVKMNKLSASIVLLAQGIPFFQAGEEILRSKPLPDGGFDENSYTSSDEVNSIKWNEKTANLSIFEYYKGLIALRKKYPLFRMEFETEVQNNLHFLSRMPKNSVGYLLFDKEDENSNEIIVLHNANPHSIVVDIPEGTWDIAVNEEKAGVESIQSTSKRQVRVESISTLVLIRKVL